MHSVVCATLCISFSQGGILKIKTIAELETLALASEAVYDVLSDTTWGRRATVSYLANDLDVEVSEKLVRTWRKKYLNEVDIQFTMPMINQYGENVNEHTFDPFSFSSHNTLTINTTTTREAPKAVSPTLLSTRKAKTIVIMPDVQAPLHDEVLVQKFVRFVGDYLPTELGQVGDFTDSTEISRWVRGKKAEYAGDLRGGFQTAKSILRDLRNVFDGRFRIVRSNHDDRLELYIEGCAPGLGSLLPFELNIEYLAGFDEYDVEFIRDEVVELAPGWVMAHGDEGSLSPVAGRTAFGLAKNKFGTSTVCGHTHRAGMTSESTGYNGKIRNTITGLEVGHFMDLTKADYLKKKGVAANWQQGFGILEVYGDRVYPRLITVNDGRFSVDGVEY